MLSTRTNTGAIRLPVVPVVSSIFRAHVNIDAASSSTCVRTLVLDMYSARAPCHADLTA